LLWCEFATEHLPLEIGSLLFRSTGDMRLEKSALVRMLKLWPGMHLPYEKTGLARGVLGAPPEELQLVLEGELKASLARFWFEAFLVPRKSTVQRNMHPEVRAALAWLDSHYQEPDVLEAFYRWLPISPNHFRVLFKNTTGGTVQNYLFRLRQRRARFLVHEIGRLLKQIAAEVGYENPLYFSRQYRKFWGHPPGEDRKIV
jgi:AraC-like DNA-binding protein